MESWKTQKIQSIKDEVKELHPLLKQIFTNNREIARYEYTHGPTEMGADFILARIDQTLGAESYIGVIAKVGNIIQDITDIKRQIEECSVDRYFDGGKKKIFLNEIWIISNGTVSNGAERKIHEEYRNRNIHFVQIEKLCEWTERYAKHYWSEVSTELSHYLNSIVSETNHQNSSIINISGAEIEINQDLKAISNNSPKKIFKIKKSPTKTLENAISENKIITIEGGMGSGKSTIIKKYVRLLCEPTTYAQRKTIPHFIEFRKISNDFERHFGEIIKNLGAIEESEKPDKIIIFIDGLADC